MAGKKYGDAEIARLLREIGGTGRNIAAELKRQGVPRRTYYNWVQRFGSGDHTTLQRLKQLEREAKLASKRLTQLERENKLLHELLGKPWRRSPPGGRPSGGR